MIITLIRKPFELILEGIFSLTGDLTTSVLIFSIIFGILYSFFNIWKRRVALRAQLAGVYARKFKENFTSSPKIFDNYLTQIYKECSVTQISSLIFGIANFLLFISIIRMIYEPLVSAYGFSDVERNTLIEFLTKNFEIDKNASDFTVLNTIFNNEATILLKDSIPEAVNKILNTSISLFGVNFTASANLNSISIFVPIAFLILYATNVIKSIRVAIKEKTKGSIFGASLGVFFLVSIATSAFFMPLLYFVFIFGYRIVTLIFSVFDKRRTDNYIKKLNEKIKPKCDRLLQEAQFEYEKENEEPTCNNEQRDENIDKGKLEKGEINNVSDNVASHNDDQSNKA